MFSRVAAAVLAAILLLPAASGRAQQVDRIAAVVGDDIITNRDLEDRLRMALALSHLPDTVDSRRRMLPQVLRKMVDEHLQMQEAKRLKVALSDKEVAEGIAAIERSNGLPPGGMQKQFSAAGVDYNLVRQNIVADLTWMRVAAQQLQPTIHVSEEEVNDRLEIIKTRRGKPEYLASEIFLPVEGLSQEEQVRTMGEKLLEQLHQGVPFPALANQFSQSPTAANGGSLGWVSDGMIDDQLLKALGNLGPGQITPLIRIDDGYHILGLVKKRIAGGGGDPSDPAATVTIAQMILPVPTTGAPPPETLVARAMQITQGAPSCDAFLEQGRKVGAVKVGQVGPVKQSDLPPPVAAAIATVDEGQVSRPLQAAEGLQILMVCNRGGIAPLPSHDQVRRQIEAERLDMLTQRYLRDLRRAAFIEVRM